MQEYIEDKNREYIDFNERFLQAIWNEQYISRNIKTESGQELKIINSGIWNRCKGPDFRNAIIEINGVQYAGDVEIHRNKSEWFQHRHNEDKEYDKVILHAVWKDDMPQALPQIPTLVLSKYVEQDWKRLLWELEDARYTYARQIHAGGCSLRWAMSDNARVSSLLTSAGMARFASKTGNILTQIASKGEERAVFEGIFDVLGYSSNRKQFGKLAEIIWDNGWLCEWTEMTEAMLWGASKMLPDVTQIQVLPECEKYVTKEWDLWWQSGCYEKLDLEWECGGARPYNRPWRRVAAAIEILKLTNCRPANWILEKAKQSEGSPRIFLKSLEKLTCNESQWRGYVDFGHRISPEADLIGRPRFYDLCVNVILPFIAAEGETENKPELKELARNTYNAIPLSQTNTIIKEAIMRYLTPPSRNKEVIKNYCQQQGMMDIYKNFCVRLENNCLECPFGT